MSIYLSPARAAASRRNGAKSRGPVSQAGKARSARNALKHGLCADSCLVAGECAQAFAGFEAAILDVLAPEGVMQRIVAKRSSSTARPAAATSGSRSPATVTGARAVLGKGAPTPSWLWRRAFDTLMRYRGSALAEFSQPLRLPQAMRNARAIQDEARTIQEPPRMRNEPETRGHADIGPSRGSTPPVHDRATIAPIGAMQNGPEARENPGDGRAQGCEPAQAPPGRAAARSGTSAWLRCRPAPAPDGTGPPGASGS